MSPEGYNPMMMFNTDRGSPPAVGGGRVFVVTNAGLVAALDADTGHLTWIYQYGSDTQAMGMFTDRGPAPPNPPNPLIVTAAATKNLVIVLPADGQDALALNVEDGSLAWKRFASAPAVGGRQRHCVALACPDVSILNVQDGHVVWEQSGNADLFGRPAVTPTTILLSGKGRLLRVNIQGPDKYSPEVLKLGPEDAVLGNLVSSAHKLVAGYCGSMSMYMGYEDAYAVLSERMKQAAGDDVARYQYERGRMALNAGRVDECLADLLAVRQYAQTGGDEALAKRVTASLYRGYILQAARMPTPPSRAAPWNRPCNWPLRPRTRPRCSSATCGTTSGSRTTPRRPASRRAWPRTTPTWSSATFGWASLRPGRPMSGTSRANWARWSANGMSRG